MISKPYRAYCDGKMCGGLLKEKGRLSDGFRGIALGYGRLSP